MATNEEETMEESTEEESEDARRMVKENENHCSHDDEDPIDSKVFEQAWLVTPLSSTHDGIDAGAIREIEEEVEEEDGKPSLLQSPDGKSSEAMANSSDHDETSPTHTTINSTHELSDVKKKKEVQFSSQAPQLVGSSSSDDDDDDSSVEGSTCADSMATDSIHSLRLSPTMLTIDTNDTSTTNRTQDTKGSTNVPPTTPGNDEESEHEVEEDEEAEEEEEEEGEEPEEEQPQAKLTNFESVPLQPQNIVNTNMAVTKTTLNDALLFSTTDTVLGGDTEPQSSSTNTVPFVFQEEEDIQESPSRLLDMQEHEYVLHKIAQIVGSQALVQDLATLYYDRDELHMIQDKEFCAAVELAFQKSDQTNQDEIETSGMCTENPLKCAVADEDWDSLVESVTAVVACKGADDVVGNDFFKQVGNSVAKSTSAMEEIYETSVDPVARNVGLSQDQVDEIKVSLKDDRQQIATLLDSWVKAMQESTIDSTENGAVARDLSISQEKFKDIADSLEQGGNGVSGLLKSWAEKIQASAPNSATSGHNATESEVFASEPLSSDKNFDNACRELALYSPDQSVAAAISEAFLNETLRASTQGKSIETSATMYRDLVLYSLGRKAEKGAFEFEAVLFLRMMVALFGEAFGEMSVSLQDNLKQADNIVQGALVFVYKFLYSSSAEASDGHLSSVVQVAGASNESKPTESAIESTVTKELESTPEATFPSDPSIIINNADTHHVVSLESPTAAGASNATQTNDRCIETIDPDASKTANITIAIKEGYAKSEDKLPQESKLNEAINSETDVGVEPTEPYTSNESPETLEVSNDNAPIDDPNLNAIKASLKKDYENIQKSFQTVLDEDSSPTSGCNEISASLERSCQELEKHLRELISYVSSIFVVNGNPEGLSNDKSLGSRDEPRDIQQAAASNDCALFFQVLGDVFKEDPKCIEASFGEDYQTIKRFVESHFESSQDFSSALSSSYDEGATEDERKNNADKPSVAGENAKNGTANDSRGLIVNDDTIVTSTEIGTKGSSDASEAVPRKLCAEMAEDKSLIPDGKNEEEADIPSEDSLKPDHNKSSLVEEEFILADTAEGMSDNDMSEHQRYKVDNIMALEDTRFESEATPVKTTNDDDEIINKSMNHTATSNEPVAQDGDEKKVDPTTLEEVENDDMGNKEPESGSKNETATKYRRPAKKARTTEPIEKCNEVLSLSTSETKVAVLPPWPERRTACRRPVKKARTTEPIEKCNEVLSPSTSDTKVDVRPPETFAECHRRLTIARKAELMHKYKDVLSPSTAEKKAVVQPPEAVAESRRPAKKNTRKTEVTNKLEEVLSPSAPEKKVLPRRESKKKTLAAKMRKKSAMVESSDCETETTLDCSDDNSIGEKPTSCQDVDVTCFLGSVFDTMLENVLGPYHLSDDSSLSSNEGQREMKPSLRGMSSKKLRKFRHMTDGKSYSTRYTSNGSIGADGGSYQQKWRRPRLNRKVQYSK